jgi:hypothetical protein
MDDDGGASLGGGAEKLVLQPEDLPPNFMRFDEGAGSQPTCLLEPERSGQVRP